jgi:sugar phosphate isomerase/epimerase
MPFDPKVPIAAITDEFSPTLSEAIPAGMGPLGTRAVRWKEQIAALLADGYPGYVSLETHWPGPGGRQTGG